MITSVQICADHEDDARHIAFSEFGSKDWFDKEKTKCFAEVKIDYPKIINYEYDYENI